MVERGMGMQFSSSGHDEVDCSASSIIPCVVQEGDTVEDFLECVDGDIIIRSHDEVMGSEMCKMHVDGMYADKIRDVPNRSVMEINVCGTAKIRIHEQVCGSSMGTSHLDVMFGQSPAHDYSG